MRIFASSGDEGGGGIDIPDQPAGDPGLGQQFAQMYNMSPQWGAQQAMQYSQPAAQPSWAAPQPAPQPAAQPAWGGGGGLGYQAFGMSDSDWRGFSSIVGPTAANQWLASMQGSRGGGGGGGLGDAMTAPAPAPAAPAAPAARAPTQDELLYKYFGSKGIPLPTAQGASGVVSPFGMTAAQQAALAGYNAETGGSMPGGAAASGGLAPSQQPWDASYYSAGGAGAGYTGGQGLYGGGYGGSDFFGGGSNPFAASIQQQPSFDPGLQRVKVGQTNDPFNTYYNPFQSYGGTPWPNIGPGSSNVNDPWGVFPGMPGAGFDASGTGFGAGAGVVPGFDIYGAPVNGGGGYGTWGGNS
jgi:hypothetical protein